MACSISLNPNYFLLRKKLEKLSANFLTLTASQ